MRKMTDKEIEDAKIYLADLKRRRDVKPIGSRPRKVEIAKKGNDYYHENKDTKIKEYRENNAEKIREYKKKYSLKYLAENKDRLIAYRKAYYLKKKEANKNEQ